jgi:2-polyprenyl-6-methoxyphenol hydroxylase-like FAD-dependent oxidoreductase
MSRPHDVVVAGGGVVLARMAFDVALVERAPPAPFAAAGYDPRVYALSPGSVRFLETLGVWRAVAAARVSPYQRMEIWDRDAQRALTFDAAECGTPELGFIVEESALRTALWSALGGVRVSVGHELAGFGVRDDRAWVRLDDGAVLEGALAVAAEGADSRLRQWVGIDTPGWSYE